MRGAVKDVLIINPFGIGDVLFTTPLIRSLKDDDPARRIGFLCNRRTEPVLRADTTVDWVFVYEKDELRQLYSRSKTGYLAKLYSLAKEIREKGFDAAIDLSLNREYGFLCWFAGIRKRIGYNYRNRGIFLTGKIDIKGYGDKHIVEYYLGLLSFLGIRPSSGGISICIPEEERRWARGFMVDNGVVAGGLLVGFAPAGGASWGRDASAKHWRPEGFTEVADGLAAKRKASFIIFGGPEEKDICDSVARTMRSKAVVSCEKTTLLQAAALMSMCGLVIANDGGPLHMAVASGARTVGIFGPVDEKVYGQYPPSPRHRVVRSDADCRPCYRNFKLKDCPDRKCLGSITAQDVLKAAEEALDAR